jgi:hypothetical protein
MHTVARGCLAVRRSRGPWSLIDLGYIAWMVLDSDQWQKGSGRVMMYRGNGGALRRVRISRNTQGAWCHVDGVGGSRLRERFDFGDFLVFEDKGQPSIREHRRQTIRTHDRRRECLNEITQGTRSDKGGKVASVNFFEMGNPIETPTPTTLLQVPRHAHRPQSGYGGCAPPVIATHSGIGLSDSCPGRQGSGVCLLLRCRRTRYI